MQAVRPSIAKAMAVGDLGNPQAEEALVGSVILGGSEALIQLDPPVSATDFANGDLGRLWNIFSQVEHPDDYVELSDAAEGEDWRLLLSEYTRLANVVPSWAHIANYAHEVRKGSALRKLERAYQEGIREVYDPANRDVASLCQLTIQRIEAIIAPDNVKAMLEWEKTFDAFADWQLERVGMRGQPRLTLPWKSLRWVRPLRKDTLAIVAAASGIGKTMFAECCAEHWARHGFRVAFFHYELSHQTMLDRRIVRWSGETMDTVEQGELTERMQTADDLMRTWSGQIQYIYCNGWPMTRLAAKARNLISRGFANVIVVDYLQKAPYKESVRGMNTSQMRAQDVETLKTLAERASAPVLLLSQLNREGQRGKRRTREGIRDTGEADEKSNLVITLDRPILNQDAIFGGQIFKAGCYSPKLTARVDKQTLGGTGDAELLMNPARFIIADIA